MRSLCVVAGLRPVSRNGTNCPVRLSRPVIREVGFFAAMGRRRALYYDPPTTFRYFGFGLS